MGTGFSVTPVINGYICMECHNLSEGAAKDMKFKCHICEPRNSRGCFAAPPLACA